MPAPQIISLLVDHFGKFESYQQNPHDGYCHGIMDYIKKHYASKKSNTTGKVFKNFMGSVVKHAQGDPEVKFFANVIEENTDAFIIGFLNKAVQVLRKNFVEFSSKGDHNFRKVKIKVQDLFKYLSQIFKPRYKNYDNMGGTPIQTRVRDYLIQMHPSVVIETNGIDFLQIVEKEALLIQNLTGQNREYVDVRDMNQYRASQSPYNTAPNTTRANGTSPAMYTSTNPTIPPQSAATTTTPAVNPTSSAYRNRQDQGGYHSSRGGADDRYHSAAGNRTDRGSQSRSKSPGTTGNNNRDGGRGESFYTISNLLGNRPVELEDDYLNDIKDYQSAKKNRVEAPNSQASRKPKYEFPMLRSGRGQDSVERSHQTPLRGNSRDKDNAHKAQTANYSSRNYPESSATQNFSKSQTRNHSPKQRRANPGPLETSKQDSVSPKPAVVVENMTFDQIYGSLRNKDLDRASSKEAQRKIELEKRLEAAKQTDDDYPEFIKKIDESKQEILNTLIERSKLLDTLAAIANHIEEEDKRMLAEQDIYTPLVVNYLYPSTHLYKPKKITEYFESARKSKFQKKRERELQKKLRDNEKLRKEKVRWDSIGKERDRRKTGESGEDDGSMDYSENEEGEEEEGVDIEIEEEDGEDGDSREDSRRGDSRRGDSRKGDSRRDSRYGSRRNSKQINNADSRRGDSRRSSRKGSKDKILSRENSQREDLAGRHEDHTDDHNRDSRRKLNELRDESKAARLSSKDKAKRSKTMAESRRPYSNEEDARDDGREQFEEAQDTKNDKRSTGSRGGSRKPSAKDLQDAKHREGIRSIKRVEAAEEEAVNEEDMYKKWTRGDEGEEDEHWDDRRGSKSRSKSKKNKKSPKQANSHKRKKHRTGGKEEESRSPEGQESKTEKRNSNRYQDRSSGDELNNTDERKPGEKRNTIHHFAPEPEEEERAIINKSPAEKRKTVMYQGIEPEEQENYEEYYRPNNDRGSNRNRVDSSSHSLSRNASKEKLPRGSRDEDNGTVSRSSFSKPQSILKPSTKDKDSRSNLHKTEEQKQIDKIMDNVSKIMNTKGSPNQHGLASDNSRKSLHHRNEEDKKHDGNGEENEQRKNEKSSDTDVDDPHRAFEKMRKDAKTESLVTVGGHRIRAEDYEDDDSRGNRHRDNEDNQSRYGDREVPADYDKKDRIIDRVPSGRFDGKNDHRDGDRSGSRRRRKDRVDTNPSHQSERDSDNGGFINSANQDWRKDKSSPDRNRKTSKERNSGSKQDQNPFHSHYINPEDRKLIVQPSEESLHHHHHISEKNNRRPDSKDYIPPKKDRSKEQEPRGNSSSKHGHGHDNYKEDPHHHQRSSHPHIGENQDHYAHPGSHHSNQGKTVRDSNDAKHDVQEDPAAYYSSYSKKQGGQGQGGQSKKYANHDADDDEFRLRARSRNRERDSDLPPALRDIDAARYENLIYTTKRKRMYIAVKDFRAPDKNYFALRQGDVVCCVTTVKGWYFVYREENPKKFGFCPGNYLNIIN